MAMDDICIRGARENNLANIDLDVARGSFTVLTGPSGSGKSSLAFDTLHAEGQRRYAEAISPQLRTALGQRPRVQVDTLTGLPPTLAVSQHGSANTHPRSTLATLTDIADLLAVLYARAGQQHCPGCDSLLERRSAGEIVTELCTLNAGTKLIILAPVLDHGNPKGLFEDLESSGFVRVRLNSEICRLDDLPEVDFNALHTVEVVIDRIRTAADRKERISDAVRLALTAGRGRLLAEIDGEVRPYSETGWCAQCKKSALPPTPQRLSFNTVAGACPVCEGLGTTPSKNDDGQTLSPCSECKGTRLGPVGRGVRLLSLRLPELHACTVTEAAATIQQLPEGEVTSVLKEELSRRLGVLDELGLAYLSLDRPAQTLSTGELQRVRIAAVCGARLCGVLYVFDEPSAGLHPSDLPRLIDVLNKLRNEGNTLVVVDHDPALVRSGERVIDFGPGAGEEGGEVVYQGEPEGLLEAPTETGLWLSGRRSLPPHTPRATHRLIKLTGASGHNLQNINFKFPLHALTVVSGPSGAGKSSLVFDTLLPALNKTPGLPYKTLSGHDSVRRIGAVNARPIGRTSRSMPATYTGLWGVLRGLYAATKEARIRGFEAGHFSLANKGGRCEACRGLGIRRVELAWLPEVHLPCEVCEGRRYDESTLAVRFRDKNLSEVLALTARQARAHFAGLRQAEPALKAMDDIGLGYLPLGRPTASLSGGESQRLKLAREVCRGSAEDTLFVLDEPCVGAHPRDVARLCNVLHELVTQGATVLVLEHDPVMLEQADRVITLGPGAGPDGGRIVS